MSDKNWKVHERVIAKLFGTQRIPNSGNPQPDIIAGSLAIQSKILADLPKWFLVMWRQTEEDAKNLDLFPLLIISHHKQGIKTKRYAIMDLDDLITILKLAHLVE